MTAKAILIGSIGVVAETSDIQRRAYNQALTEAGLDWHWDVETYKLLLTKSGGRERLKRLSEELEARLTGTEIAQIHNRKTDLACQEIIANGITLRAGVRSLLDQCASTQTPVAFVTTTYMPNVDAIARGSRGELDLSEFAFVLTTEDVTRTKPDPEVYRLALERLELGAQDCLAIEDSTTSIAAAQAAGIPTLATPGRFTRGQNFESAEWQFGSIQDFLVTDPALLRELDYSRA
ncbi:MAG: HAD-IA family hydrolase [Pseudomonadota bacterium]